LAVRYLLRASRHLDNRTGGIVEDVTGQPESSDLSELHSRIQKLEVENAELKSSSPGVDAHGRKERVRNRTAITLAVLAGLLLALSVPAIWLNRMVTDTEWYVRTVAPLAEDPDIQASLAAAVSEPLIERIDAKSRLEEVLPENLQIVAAPLGSAVDDFIRANSLSLVRSDQFARVWEEVNRRSHNLMVAAVTGREGAAVGTEAGTISLDTGILADSLKDRLTDAGLAFATRIPTGSLDQRVVLYESPLLAQMTAVIDGISRAALLIPFVGLALAAGALLAAVDKRKAALWLGGTLVIAGILPLQALYLGQYHVTARLETLQAIPTPAADAAFGIIFRDLIAADRAIIALGVVLWASALVLGPASWAVAMRRGSGSGLSAIAAHLELGRFGVWVRERKRGLRGAGVVIALIVLLGLPAPRTVGSILWLALGYSVWVLLVELFAAEPGPAIDC
jgi:hypothetical protein